MADSKITLDSKALFPDLRPPGPPRVWTVVESRRLKDKDGNPAKFVIQEIPEDRHAEVVEHMCTHFIADEPMCRSQRGIEDPEYVDNFRAIWAELVKQGFAVAAFIDDPAGGKPIVAGVNMLGVDLKSSEHKPDDFKLTNEKAMLVLGTVIGLNEEARVYEHYNVDKYLYAFGLSVKPEYRGESLGGHILRVRDKIGAEYKIPVTSTGFTSPISQKLAERCGFETLLERDYADIKDKQGNVAFPNTGVKTFRIMGKRLY